MPLRHPFWLLALVDRIMLQSRAIEYATVTARPALQQSGGKAAEVGRLARTFCCRPSPSELLTAVIHRLELPHGRFERRIRLPSGHYERVRRAAAHGCLVITLEKSGAFRG